MIGAAPAPATAPSSELDERAPALRVRALSVPGPRGQRDGVGRRRRGGRHRGAHRLRPDGAARGDLRDAADRAQGSIELAGTELRHGQIAEAIEHGLAYVPGDRKNQGLVLSMSVTENLMMATTSRKMRLRVPSRSLERAETREPRGDVRDRRRVAGRRVFDAQRRQPTEGGHREVDARIAPRPPDGRADAGSRRRCEARDLSPPRRRASGGRRDPRRAPPRLRSCFSCAIASS